MQESMTQKAHVFYKKFGGGHASAPPPPPPSRPCTPGARILGTRSKTTDFLNQKVGKYVIEHNNISEYTIEIINVGSTIDSVV